VVLPAGRESEVDRIVTFDGDLDLAVAGQSVTLTLADEIDVSRGDVIAPADDPPEVADRFEATVVWMAEEPMLPGRSYLLRTGSTTASATTLPLRYKLEIDTLEHLAADTLEVNEIGVCALELDRPIAFDPYEENRDTGGFVLIDRITNDTLAAGMLRFPIRRAENVYWQAIDVDKAARAALNRQRPCIVWLTGLSGAGKSTIANLVEGRLHSLGHHTYMLDGDNVRHGLNKDLGFTDVDRVENIRRVIETARLMADAGLIVLVSFISPFRAERRLARDRLADDAFLEIFVDTPLAECERRDPKGLYHKARVGELRNFTGIDSAYEPPDAPDLHLRTLEMTVEREIDLIVDALRGRSVFD
jgi:bifunctional enzyme CysN/CysC